MNELFLYISIALNVIIISGLVFFFFKRGGISYLKKKTGLVYTYKHSIFGPYYDQRKAHFETLPRKNNDIIFLGHSIIDGCELAELFNNPLIKNRGISGETTEGLLNRLDNITITPPHKLFIMTGANDIGYGWPIEKMLGNCVKIVEIIKQQCPSTMVYLISVLPVGLDYNKQVNDVIKIFNDGLKNIADQNEYIYIDLNIIFRNNDDLMDLSVSNDGSHLMGKAYLTFKEKLLPYMD